MIAQMNRCVRSKTGLLVGGAWPRIGSVLLVVGMSSLLAIAPASATVPTQVQYQGLLLDSNGLPLTNAVDLGFEIFDSITGGASLWTESHSAVSVTDGVYAVALGSILPLDATVLTSAAAFLEVTVDGETLTPRQQLLAVPYALVAGNIGSIKSEFVEQLLQHATFDGAGPGNFDSREGLADVDGDGRANFMDSDNDGDGLSDGAEITAGSDINLVTPTIGSFLPGTADGFVNNTITLVGTNLNTVTSVQFGTASPTPTSVTATSFDVLVPSIQPAGEANVTVTLTNGEQATSTYDFFFVAPTITSITPDTIPSNVVTTVTVVGTNFVAGLIVDLDGSPIVPTSQSSTTLTLDLGPLNLLSHLVTVTHPNGVSASVSLTAFPNEPKTVFITSANFTADFGGIVAADALCQSAATAGSLTGTYKAWLSDSSSSPSTNFTLDVGPYRLQDGTTVVATSWVDLTDGSLANSISRTELGVQKFANVWTSTQPNGTHHSTFGDCSDWTALSSSSAGQGFSSNSASGWTDSHAQQCLVSNTASLYCFEQ